MKVAIIDYGSGNLRSAAKAFERASAEENLGATVTVTNDPAHVLAADRVVLPGVGAYGDCSAGLRAVDGMVEAMEEVVLKQGKPFFGICVGMQLLASRGREHGDHDGLGWIPGEVVRIEPTDPALKVPHMGWNDLQVKGNHPLFADVPEGSHAYFVHSYHFLPENPDHVLATVDYGQAITAAVGRDNIIGTQFHPEKSQATGLKVIADFLKWQI